MFLQRQSPPFKLTAMIRALRCNRNRREPLRTVPAAILCKDRADFRHSGLPLAAPSSAANAEILRQFCRNERDETVDRDRGRSVARGVHHGDERSLRRGKFNAATDCCRPRIGRRATQLHALFGNTVVIRICKV
ncbi:hypothetical protein JQ616_31285 [Bradyrhizobium tropiciagri]|uniref:hypothetical protein n=1 Tax=Bradyrhizobium tropiciagri TaxID=312253 RepID=UPI001BA86EE2|nr:hypothetical protein [Bradyrhizobium tropiciagri]MBR0899458.1 hypothetical protein [Bradyrhizobium tropiciagri]